MEPGEETSEWIGIADLMSVLVLVFLLLVVLADIDSRNKETAEIDAIATLEENDQVEDLDVEPETSVLFDSYTSRLNYALKQAFKTELQDWNAVIDPDNTIRFRTPEAFFETGSSTIQPRFLEILNKFFPKYASILQRRCFKDKIVEIRIEGHTSEEWKGASTQDDRYINNVRLSQDRAYSVLAHSWGTIDVWKEKLFLTNTLRAVGMSYAKQCYIEPLGLVDKGCSRRVEYRVVVEHDKSNASTLKKCFDEENQ